MKSGRALIAELFGTFVLTFVDAGLAIVSSGLPIKIDYLARCLAPGLVIMAMIFALGEVSGAHFNPAVTLGFVARGVFPLKRALAYISMQVVGAILAAAFLFTFFNNAKAGLSETHTTIGLACFLELITSVFLVFTILSTACESNVKGPEAAFPVAGTLVFCGLIAKGLTGASMNPARSLGPAAVAGYYQDLWIYISMPLIGSLIAVMLVWLTHGGPNKKESKQAKG